MPEDAQPALSFDAFREKIGSGSSPITMPFFCREITFPDAQMEGSFEFSSETKQEILRTGFMRVDAMNQDDSSKSSAASAPVSREDQIKVLTRNPIMLQVLDLLLRPGTAAAKYNEFTSAYASVFSEGEPLCDGTNKLFFQPAKTDSGVLLYNFPGGLTYVYVHRIFGDNITSSLVSAVAKDAKPDIIFLTYFCLREMKNGHVSMDVKDQAIIYNLTKLTGHLILRCSDFLGDVKEWQGDHYIVDALKDFDVSLSPSRPTEASGGQSDIYYSRCCERHKQEEQKYFRALESVLSAPECKLSLKAFRAGMVSYDLEIKLFLFVRDCIMETRNFLSTYQRDALQVTQEARREFDAYKAFKGRFEAASGDCERLTNIVLYFETPRQSNAWYEFWKDSQTELFSLGEASIQAKFIQHLSGNASIRALIFPVARGAQPALIDQRKIFIENISSVLNFKVRYVSELARFGRVQAVLDQLLRF